MQQLRRLAREPGRTNAVSWQSQLTGAWVDGQPGSHWKHSDLDLESLFESGKGLLWPAARLVENLGDPVLGNFNFNTIACKKFVDGALLFERDTT